jgi:hypothetical protein
MKLLERFFNPAEARSSLVLELVKEFNTCSDLLRRFGVKHQRASADRFKLLMAVNSISRLKLIQCQLINYNDILNSLSETQDLSNRRQIWLAFKKLKLRGHPAIVDEFDKIKDEVTEIYTLSGMQVFRTISFFDHCSYDLETIFMTPLYYLYDREQSAQWAVFREIAKALSGIKSNFHFENVPDHMVSERDSEAKLNIWMKLGVLAALRSQDEMISSAPLLLVSSSGVILTSRHQD